MVMLFAKSSIPFVRVVFLHIHAGLSKRSLFMVGK